MKVFDSHRAKVTTMRTKPTFCPTLHSAALAMAFAALIALAPAPAQASGGDLALGINDLDGVGTTLSIGSAAVFGVIDVAFIASARPMPPWLSFMQLIIAGVLGPAIGMSDNHTIEFEVAAITSGLVLGGYAFFDLVRYPDYHKRKLREDEERQHERELERERERGRCGLSIEPRPQGALLHVYGRM